MTPCITYDLLCAQDNVYSREVSLHDLHAMHQGVGIPGHLRLTLKSILPRFITRYNFLRDQITRGVSQVDLADREHVEVSHYEGVFRSHILNSSALTSLGV